MIKIAMSDKVRSELAVKITEAFSKPKNARLSTWR